MGISQYLVFGMLRLLNSQAPLIKNFLNILSMTAVLWTLEVNNLFSFQGLIILISEPILFGFYIREMTQKFFKGEFRAWTGLISFIFDCLCILPFFFWCGSLPNINGVLNTLMKCFCLIRSIKVLIFLRTFLETFRITDFFCFLWFRTTIFWIFTTSLGFLVSRLLNHHTETMIDFFLLNITQQNTLVIAKLVTFIRAAGVLLQVYSGRKLLEKNTTLLQPNFKRHITRESSDSPKAIKHIIVEHIKLISANIKVMEKNINELKQKLDCYLTLALELEKELEDLVEIQKKPSFKSNDINSDVDFQSTNFHKFDRTNSLLSPSYLGTHHKRIDEQTLINHPVIQECKNDESSLLSQYEDDKSCSPKDDKEHGPSEKFADFIGIKNLPNDSQSNYEINFTSNQLKTISEGVEDSSMGKAEFSRNELSNTMKGSRSDSASRSLNKRGKRTKTSKTSSSAIKTIEVSDFDDSKTLSLCIPPTLTKVLFPEETNDSLKKRSTEYWKNATLNSKCDEYDEIFLESENEKVDCSQPEGDSMDAKGVPNLFIVKIPYSKPPVLKN